MNTLKPVFCLLGITLFPIFAMESSVGADESKFEKASILLTKYCAGCHNQNDANGDFKLDDYQSILDGGESGNALTPGSAASSRMIQMMRGKLEPAMPPEGEAQPSEEEINLIADWIDDGAIGPTGKTRPTGNLRVPKIKGQTENLPITAIALSPRQAMLAVGKFQSLEIGAPDQSAKRRIDIRIPGKVTALEFVNEQLLLVASGVTGLYGEVLLINVESGKIIRRYRGHSDMIYGIAISPNRRWLATCSYDRKAILWELAAPNPVREFIGHNDAIFDCCFDLESQLLMTASADSTVKVWRIEDGVRLDTRGEPLKEQYTVTPGADGQSFFAGGADNRIRKWSLESRSPNQTNPLQLARIAHEAPIQILRHHPVQKQLVSIATNGVIKIWNPVSLEEIYRFKDSFDGTMAMAVANDRLILGQRDGTLRLLPWPTGHTHPSVTSNQSGLESDSNQPSSKLATGKSGQLHEIPGGRNGFERRIRAGNPIASDCQRHNQFTDRCRCRPFSVSCKQRIDLDHHLSRRKKITAGLANLHSRLRWRSCTQSFVTECPRFVLHIPRKELDTNQRLSNSQLGRNGIESTPLLQRRSGSTLPLSQGPRFRIQRLSQFRSTARLVRHHADCACVA